VSELSTIFHPIFFLVLVCTFDPRIAAAHSSVMHLSCY
jgi:hypothetical protein